MITEQMQRLLNQLINVEYASAYLYQAMSTYFNRVNMRGMAHWLRMQYEEELGHAVRLVDYLIDRGGTVELLPIPAQKTNYGSPLEGFQQVLAHEQMVTDTYRNAFDTVSAAKDYQTLGIIQEFLAEQVDEVAQAQVIVGRLQLAGSNAAAILQIDQELGQRAAAEATAPVQATAAPAD